MGSTGAQSMAAIGSEYGVSLEAQIEWQLRSNHYPPVPSSMVPVAIAAIDALNEQDNERAIELPEGITYKDETTAPAGVIVESYHLDVWVAQEDW